MLTGHEKALPLTFFYSEYRGTPNRRKSDKKGDLIKKDCRCKSLLGWQLCLGVPESSSTKRNQKFIENVAWYIPNNRSASRRSFYRLSTGRAAHYENIKPHNASTEDWCIPADMHEENYLIVDPACEVNKRGARDKNDGNEVVDSCDLPLDLELTKRVEVDDETVPFAEEDWDYPERNEVDKGVHLDFPFTMETRQSKEEKARRSTIRMARVLS